jgi:hypothetical protein
MHRCAVRTLTHCARCAGCSDALSLPSAADAMSERSMVSVQNDITAIRAACAPQGTLSRAAALVPACACSRLFMLPVCSSSAPSAACGRQGTTSTAASAATVTICSIGRRPVQLRQPLPRPRLPRRSHSSAVRRAARTSCRLSSEQPSSRCTASAGPAATSLQSCAVTSTP